jgi:hypothetical protein
VKLSVLSAGAEAEHGHRWGYLAAVVPTVAAAVRVPVPGDVSDGDGRSRARRVRCTQHHRVCARWQRPRLFPGLRSSYHREYRLISDGILNVVVLFSDLLVLVLS